MQSFRDPYSCTMISNSAKDKTQLHIPSVVVVLIQHKLAQSSSLTINSDLAVSIFVCSFEERFRLIVREISSLLGKALENVPVDHTSKTRVCRGEFVPCGAGLPAWVSLELVLFYKAAAVHIQNPKNVFDAFRRHGSETHQFKELLWIKGFI